jgi:hypothetical protein
LHKGESCAAYAESSANKADFESFKDRVMLAHAGKSASGANTL